MRGFTVIELMLTAALVGTLASIAIPYSRHLRVRAQRAEAMIALKGIYTAEVAYYTEVDRYSDSFETIGFDLEGGELVDENTLDGKSYRFALGTYTYDGKPHGNFWATATADLTKGDGVLDILLIENDVLIKE